MPQLVSLAVERLKLERDVLAGRVAVVTGGGRGIGREVVRALAWLGARVVIAELAETGGEVEKLVRDAGGTALFIKTDVASEAEVTRLAEATQAAFGPADILINNAILCPPASVMDMEVALWDKVIAVNLRGTFLTCKTFLPAMVARRCGLIVNMISTDAMPYLSAYIASKQGIAAFSQSLAGEVGESGVRVIAFGPGFVDTPGLRGAARGLGPRMGLTEEQFMKLSLHPAYAEAMPPDHAAAATAYLVAKLADEYHGEQVMGYTVLERAGFIEQEGRGREKEEGERNRDAAPKTQSQAPLAQALKLSEQLQQMLSETEAEFTKLPIFVRPLAKQGFRGKAGQSGADWAHTAADLSARLAKIAEGDAAAHAGAQADAQTSLGALRPKLKGLLGKLEVYYQDVPAETARFTKDRELLEQIGATTRQRVEIIRALAAVLETL